MTYFLRVFLTLLIPLTLAAEGDAGPDEDPGGGGQAGPGWMDSQLGDTGEGVADMWASICSVMPCADEWNPYATPWLLAGKIFRFMSVLFIGVAIFVLAYGGIRIITSRGSDEGLNEGKKIVLYALAGIALFSLTYVIIGIAVDLFTRMAT